MNDVERNDEINREVKRLLTKCMDLYAGRFEDAARFRWLLENATLTTTLRNGVKVWSLEVVGDYPHDAGMQDVRDMIDVSRGA